jgi:polysaccharide export outer membrane protein
MLYLISIALLATLSVAQTTGPSAAAVSTAFPVIASGDALRIQAFQSEEISREWRVSESGDLDLPMIGRIHVAGMRTSQLEGHLKEALRKFVRNPAVTVQVTQKRKFPVTLTGAVEKPGVVMLEESQTLFDAIVLAGGLKDPGTHMLISRPVDRGKIPLPEARGSGDGRFWTCKLDVAEVSTGRTGSATLPLTEDDLINVEPREPRMVHIIGEVIRPGSVELVQEQTVSLLKLVAVAGGLTRMASPKKVLIRKLGQEGIRGESAMIDLEQITKGRAADLMLTPGDVVVVQSSNFKTYVQAATSSALSSGIFTGLQTLARF